MSIESRSLAIRPLALTAGLAVLCLPSCGLGPSVTLGYADDAPVALVRLADGLSIETRAVTYERRPGRWELTGYAQTITLPDGQTIQIELDELGTERYRAVLDGVTRRGPSLAEFKKRNWEHKSLVGFAPSRAGEVPMAPLISLPCSGKANVRRTDDFAGGVATLSQLSLTCEQKTYAFTFSNWQTHQQGADRLVSGFKVALAIGPAPATPATAH